MIVKTLYLTYDGLTDPLGRSQVLPYLIGLSKKGFEITIVSFEKRDALAKNKEIVGQLVNENNLTWIPHIYTKRPPIFSTLWDIWKLKKTVKKICEQQGIGLIHCRSYITSMVGLSMKREYEIPFLFDMRGFWADERVEGGIWNLNNPIFRTVYNFIKKKEKSFLMEADHVISLTKKATEIIKDFDYLKNRNVSISIIPTCVDEKHFDKEKIEKKKLGLLRTKLGIDKSKFVVTYIGSLGTWYMLDEMMEFFSKLSQKNDMAVFLIATKDDHSIVYNTARKFKVEVDKLIVVSATRDEIPYVISLSNWSMFFIKPVFSKTASAPTKLGEIINLGKPVLCNYGVGDIDWLFDTYQLGLGIKAFNEKNFGIAVDFLLENQQLEVKSNEVRDFFSLEKGVLKLTEIYQELILK